MSAGPDRAADIDAAALLLQRLGVAPEELRSRAAAAPRVPVPTFGEYIPVVSAAVTGRTRAHYLTYWNRILEHWAGRRLDEPTASEIKALVQTVKAGVVVRRNARGGRSAEEHLISALRCVYRHARDDGLIQARQDPAARVAKPRRLPTDRRALPDDLLAEIHHVAASTGNDPDLDRLILRLHTETACRRGGALALRPCDLDPRQCLILLREKGETTRWQPVSPTLMAALCRHGIERGAPDNGRLLRYRNGNPVTARRYDGLWTRLGKHLPWVATHGVTAHWIRYTTLTWVERNFGYAVARRFAGHTDQRGEGATTTYIRAQLEEVADAVAALTGEPHPLAPTPRTPTPPSTPAEGTS